MEVEEILGDRGEILTQFALAKNIIYNRFKGNYRIQIKPVIASSSGNSFTLVTIQEESDTNNSFFREDFVNEGDPLYKRFSHLLQKK